MNIIDKNLWKLVIIFPSPSAPGRVSGLWRRAWSSSPSPSLSTSTSLVITFLPPFPDFWLFLLDPGDFFVISFAAVWFCSASFNIASSSSCLWSQIVKVQFFCFLFIKNLIKIFPLWKKIYKFICLLLIFLTCTMHLTFVCRQNSCQINFFFYKSKNWNLIFIFLFFMFLHL